MFSKLLQNLFRPKTLKLSLQPVAGEFYAHVFENDLTGLARDLFWNFYVEVEPVTLDGEAWDCSFSADWFRWPLRTWHDLDGVTIRKAKRPDMVETSLYLMAEHHPAHLTKFELLNREGASFEAVIEATAHVATDKGKRIVPVSFAARMQFTGIIVVPNNLQPKSCSATSAAAAVAEFIQLEGLGAPRSEGSRYIFDPIH